MSQDCTVVLLTKLPGLMPVKTRLVPLLGEEGAREAYVEMLERSVAIKPLPRLSEPFLNRIVVLLFLHSVPFGQTSPNLWIWCFRECWRRNRSNDRVQCCR